MSGEPIKRGMDRYVSDEMFQRENEEYHRTPPVAQVFTAPVDGSGFFESIGTIEPNSAPWFRITDEPSPTESSSSIRRTADTFSIELRAVKVNRDALRLYGFKLPRSERSIRRRRNKLRRKRINRRRS